MNPVLLAAALSCALGLVEFLLALRKRPALRALPWLLVFLGFDASAGLFGYFVVGFVIGGTEWATPMWIVLIAGLTGPAILRAQLALLGSGQESSYYGPANRFGRLRQDAVNRADDICAAAQSRWAGRMAAKVLKRGVDEVVFEVETYIDGRSDLDEPEKREILDFMSRVIADEGIDDLAKCRAVLTKLLKHECRSVIVTLARKKS